MIRRVFLASLLTLAASLAFGAHAFAQMASDVSVSLSPENPGPNQAVNITLTSYSVNIQSSVIEWTIDNNGSVGGVGATQFGIKTKALGVPTNIHILIIPPDSGEITKDITVVPMSVDLLWEATDSAVPPLYRGKAMPTSESTIKFVAIPLVLSTSGAVTPSNNLVYDWGQEYNADQSASGYGKDSYTVSMDYLNPTKHVEVQATTRDGGRTASSDIDVTPVDPKLVWYASSPLYGPIFDMALSGFYNVSTTDTSVFAMPYFFSPGSPSSNNLTYTWSINGNPVSTPAIPNSIYLQKNPDSSGTANIDLSVISMKKLFQEATSHLDLYLN